MPFWESCPPQTFRQKIFVKCGVKVGFPTASEAARSVVCCLCAELYHFVYAGDGVLHNRRASIPAVVLRSLCTVLRCLCTSSALPLHRQIKMTFFWGTFKMISENIDLNKMVD